MLAYIKNLLWGVPTAVIICAFGLYFIIKLGFFKISRIKHAALLLSRSIKSDKQKGISVFGALSTALGGTVGIGSITGVGVALAAGGAGSLFWMWVCGIFSAAIKYAEIYLAVKDRKSNNGIMYGGCMYSLSAMKKPILATLFSFACIVSSFATGNAIQASVIGQTLSQNGIALWVTGAVLAVITALCVFGGQVRIAKISASVVPLASVIYLALVIYIISARASMLPSVLRSVFTSAFGINQIGGGIAGSAVSIALRTGMVRGIFSNEAGMGSSPIAHASADNATPKAQGVWGICEIITDTFIFSTLTAIALLCCGTDDAGYMFGSMLGHTGKLVFPVLITIFAFASVISWCYYSESCIRFVAGKHFNFLKTVYRVAVVLCVFMGTGIDSACLWDAADIVNVFMLVPNMYCIFVRRKDIA